MQAVTRQDQQIDLVPAAVGVSAAQPKPLTPTEICGADGCDGCIGLSCGPAAAIPFGP